MENLNLILFMVVYYGSIIWLVRATDKRNQRVNSREEIERRYQIQRAQEKWHKINV